MTQRKNKTIRMSVELLEWFARNGLPIAEQLRNDIALLRAILEIAETETEIGIKQALAFYERLGK